MRSAPSFCWTWTAVAGMGLSPLTVARMIMSRSATVSPAASMADRPAEAAMSLVVSPGAATWRRSMPVCWRIQPSVVETRGSISALLTPLAGTWGAGPEDAGAGGGGLGAHGRRRLAESGLELDPGSGIVARAMATSAEPHDRDEDEK